jgi:hypothetical protein
MNQKHFMVEESAAIPAGNQHVYDLLKNYHPDGHPSILPTQYFTSLTVVEGGVGAGTVIDVEMKVSGNVSRMRLVVSEPKPGLLLQEEDKAQGLVTHFELEPKGGNACRLTLRTFFPKKPGLRGFFERLLVPGITRKIYRAELGLIAKRFRGS